MAQTLIKHSSLIYLEGMVRGIRYANDSSLKVIREPYPSTENDGRYHMILEDLDKAEDDVVDLDYSVVNPQGA